MKTKQSILSYVAVSLVAVAMISATTPAPAAPVTAGIVTAPEGDGPHAIEGSWQVVVSPTGLPQFNELITFTPDGGGGIIETNNFPFFTQNLTAGPGHGTWSSAPHHQFVFTFYKFLFDLSTGNAAGTLKVIGTINYSHHDDTWTSPADEFVCDNQGQNCFQIGHTESSATRIHAGE